jgi:CubicO group peptidase (beta-lactamase class C family)
MASKGMLRDLQGYVDATAREHGAPALSVAVWHAKTLSAAASGVLNVESQVQATVDSVFQIGSITKVFTASLIMLLVDEGRIELDRPVKHYLRRFHVADTQASESITLRHLLSHTSGLISDSSYSPDDPYDEENAIARYVDRCFLLPQAHHKIGRAFSYSNAAYVIAGRVVEMVTGLTWRQAIEKNIFNPLNMTKSLARPTELLRFRAAMGHFISGSLEQRNRNVTLSPYCYLSSGAAPSGSTLMMSASDLVKFGKAHLSGGRTESGTRWMSEESIVAMREAQIALPQACGTFENGWGVGWNVFHQQGVQGFGHMGGTAGQEALLHVIPAHDCVFAVQSNGIRLPGLSLARQVLSDLFYEVADVKLEQEKPALQSQDFQHLTGTFGAGAWRFEIREDGGRLRARMEAEGFMAPALFDLRCAGPGRFAMYPVDDKDSQTDCLTFLEPDLNGLPRYLFWGYRLHPRMHR